MIGVKLIKRQFTEEQYFKCAEWCNAHGATIEDKDEYYEVVEIPVHVPTEAEIQAELTAAVQAYMDSMVQTRGYDNIHTACSYCNSTDHIFAAEGQACLQWRDKIWRFAYAYLDAVKAGKKPIPTKEELLEMIPALDWDNQTDYEALFPKI